MTRSIVTAFSILLYLSVKAQVPTFDWAKKFGAQGSDQCLKILLDEAGNTITVGLFERIVDFDPGPGIFNLINHGDVGFDVFIVKTDPAGNTIWAKSFGGRTPEGLNNAKLDDAGNIYLTGAFQKTVDFDPGPAVHAVSSVTPSCFLLKLDADGEFIWVEAFGNATITDLDVDRTGNVFACGYFEQVTDFDPGSGTYNLTQYGYDGTKNTAGSTQVDGFILKLDDKGNFIWIKQIEGSLTQSIHYINLDITGNIYVTGDFSPGTDFDPGPGQWITNQISGRGIVDGCVLKLSPTGDFIWVHRYGGPGNSGIEELFSDDVGNIYVVGYFETSIDVDAGAGENILSPGGSNNTFILKLNPLGEFLWVRQLDFGGRMKIDYTGNIYVVGSYENTVDFNPGPGVFNLTSNGYRNTFILKLDNNGNFIWAISIEMKNLHSSIAQDWLIDSANNIYLVGIFDATSDFDPGPGSYNVTPERSDGFVLKLRQCPDITFASKNIDTVTCNTYTLNNQTYFRTGTYVQSFKNAAGCDSMLTINLTINPQPEPLLGPDRYICNGLPVTFAPGTYSSYLWQDMSSSSTFTTNTPGIYWVTVSNGGNCSVSDTIILKGIVPSPSNFIKVKDSICPNGTITLQPLKKFAAYNWSTGSTDDHIRTKITGLYWLEVTDDNGCSATDTIMVSNKDCPKGVNIPNAFTPNNDGRNDIFKALVYEDVKSFKLQVFDRWGRVVFESTDPSRGWDGKNKGISLSSSVFIWQCRYQIEGKEPEFQKGTVLLIK